MVAPLALGTLVVAVSVVSVAGIPLGSFCGGQVALQAGSEVQFNSPYYPYAYPRGAECLWIAHSPRNSAIRMTCQNFNVFPAPSCQVDTFYFSPSGDVTMADALFYCGNGALDLTTNNNVFAAAFSSRNYFANSYPGFRCTLTVVDKNEGL